MTRHDLLTYDGITQPILEWALDYGITPQVILTRLARGLPIDTAITKPIRTKPGERLPAFDAMLSTTRRKPPPPHTQRYKYHGRSLTLDEWAAVLGVTANAIRSRMKAGHPPAVVFAPKRPPHHAGIMVTYDGQTRCLAEWARLMGIARSTLGRRLTDGWTIEQALTTPSRNKKRRGVGSNLPACAGTGGGSVARERTQIEFSANPESSPS